MLPSLDVVAVSRSAVQYHWTWYDMTMKYTLYVHLLMKYYLIYFPPFITMFKSNVLYYKWLIYSSHVQPAHATLRVRVPMINISVFQKTLTWHSHTWFFNKHIRVTMIQTTTHPIHIISINIQIIIDIQFWSVTLEDVKLLNSI